jgi:hypothetical protein
MQLKDCYLLLSTDTFDEFFVSFRGRHETSSIHNMFYLLPFYSYVPCVKVWLSCYYNGSFSKVLDSLGSIFLKKINISITSNILNLV